MNKRIFSFTDDLSHSQIVALLDFIMVHGNSFANIKKWRRDNNLPIDKAD